MKLKTFLISIGRSEGIANGEPSVLDESDKVSMNRIVAHFNSYTLSYDINDPGDLESLVSGFTFETGVEVDMETYKTAVTLHQLSKGQAAITLQKEEISNINI